MSKPIRLGMVCRYATTELGMNELGKMVRHITRLDIMLGEPFSSYQVDWA